MYEAHITFNRQDGHRVKELNLKKWKYSQIDGDPVLGKKVFCYLTTHAKDEDTILLRVYDAVQTAQMSGVAPIRSKIEKIVHDKIYEV